MYLNNNELDLKVKVLIETENYMELIKLALALEIHEDQYSLKIKKDIIRKYACFRRSRSTKKLSSRSTHN